MGWYVMLNYNGGCTPLNPKPCLEGWPNAPVSPAFRAYWLITAGSYTHELLATAFKITTAQQPQDMVIHHLVTLVMYGSAYFYGIHRSGLMTVCLMDLSTPLLGISQVRSLERLGSYLVSLACDSTMIACELLGSIRRSATASLAVCNLSCCCKDKEHAWHGYLQVLSVCAWAANGICATVRWWPVQCTLHTSSCKCHTQQGMYANSLFLSCCINCSVAEMLCLFCRIISCRRCTRLICRSWKLPRWHGSCSLQPHSL